MNLKKSTVYLLMTFSASLWAGAFIAGKLSVGFIPTFSLTFMRFLIASAALFAIKPLFSKGQPYKLKRRDIPILLYTGVAGMFGYHTMFYLALKHTTATNASIIAALNPIFTVLMISLITKKGFGGRMAAGVGLSFVGVLLTITGGNLRGIFSGGISKGDIIMFVATILWASYSVVSRLWGKDIPPVDLTFYSFLICLVTLFPFAMAEKPWEWLPLVPVSAFVAVAYMGLFPSIIGYLVQQISIKRIGAGRTSIFINLVPLFSMFLAVTVLNEKFYPIKLATAALIVAGVCLCQWERRPTDGIAKELSTE